MIERHETLHVQCFHQSVEVGNDEETCDNFAGIKDDMDGLVDGQSTRVDPVHSAPSPAPQHTIESSRGKRRKRLAEGGVSVVGDGIESMIEHLTNAINKYADEAIPLHLDGKKIFEAVMEMAAHGTFSKNDLYDVYCHLVDNERDARKFMGGNTELRLRWLTRHFARPRTIAGYK